MQHPNVLKLENFFKKDWSGMEHNQVEKRFGEVIDIKTIEELHQQLEVVKAEVLKTYYIGLAQHFRSNPNLHDIDQIVCFGLGIFTHSIASLTQLAVLMMLHHDLGLTTPIVIYEPRFTKLEKTILNHISMPTFELLHHNSNGHYPISADSKKTLFYLPHLEFVPNEGVIASNWNHLERIVLFGGIIKQRVLDYAERYNPGKFPCTQHLVRNSDQSKHVVHRVRLANNFKIKYAFSNMDIFWFQKK